MRNKIFTSYYVWWKNIDKVILSIISSLFILGLFFSLVSTSIIASDRLNTNSYYFFIKHLIFIILSISVFISLSFIEKKKLFNISIVFFLISFIFLTLVPLIGSEVKGSKRWIDLVFLPSSLDLVLSIIKLLRFSMLFNENILAKDISRPPV